MSPTSLLLPFPLCCRSRLHHLHDSFFRSFPATPSTLLNCSTTAHINHQPIRCLTAPYHDSSSYNNLVRPPSLLFSRRTDHYSHHLHVVKSSDIFSTETISYPALLDLPDTQYLSLSSLSPQSPTASVAVSCLESPYSQLQA